MHPNSAPNWLWGNNAIIASMTGGKEAEDGDGLQDIQERNHESLRFGDCTRPHIRTPSVKARLRKYAMAIRVTEKKAYFGKAPG